MKNCIFLLGLVLLLLSCKNNSKPIGPKKAADSSRYFAINAFINEQIVDVDLRAYPIYLIKEINGKKDSMGISKEDFKAYASVFLQKDISDPAMHDRFTETVFHDLSTKSYTLNYRPKSADESIQNIDILLDENTNLVKRIFIRSESQHGDTIIIEQCNWKTDKSFQINRVSKAAGGYLNNEFNYINWNDAKK